ncbi:hypothetical protein BSI_15100 [Bacillus inaquosorum KCTC 13429]|uniref:Uncharacterized protein n=1 Tax=Bacillus inaquosorum KCTC 13429 TaxID=1236548 RepID=A0A9W5PE87_9BACI|nr:hypothetical protein BSI_15100 [Bacillus inaquosorum KCTC 13429]
MHLQVNKRHAITSFSITIHFFLHYKAGFQKKQMFFFDSSSYLS